MTPSNEGRRFETTINGVTAWAGPWSPSTYAVPSCYVYVEGGVQICVLVDRRNRRVDAVSDSKSAAATAVYSQVLLEAAALARGEEEPS